MSVVAAASPASGVSVTAITVAADYPHSRAVYAIAELPNCQAACAELLRSRDGGATWTRARAQGWQPGSLMSAMFHDRAVLVAWWQDAVALSLDGGDSFTVYATDGSPSSAAADGTAIDVVVSGGGGTSLLSLPKARERAVPGASDLDHTVVSLTTAYPSPPAGVPAAFALGVDRISGSARLEPCDASLSCSSPIAVPSGGTIVSSPAFTHDLTFFLLGAHGLERSTDGGRSITPIIVMAPSSQTFITTVTGLAFTPDFDAAAHRGAVFAGVISASRATHGARLSGGVFRSDDAGTTWTRRGAATDFGTGVSALDVAPDRRAFAGAYEFGNGAGGLYCAVGDSWSRTCPPYSSTRGDMAGTSPGRARPIMSQPPAPAEAVAPVAAGAAREVAAPPQRSSSAPAGAVRSGGARALFWVVGLLTLTTAAGAFVRARRRPLRRAAPMD
jgi:hypothetical protein